MLTPPRRVPVAQYAEQPAALVQPNCLIGNRGADQPEMASAAATAAVASGEMLIVITE